MNKEEIIGLFSDFIEIQSVSTDPKRQDQMVKAVDFLSNILEDLGFDIKVFQKSDAPPLLIAQYTLSTSAKTIGIYGHYDVQPEDPINEWSTKPFKLTLKNGKFYGRGTSDDKGHVIQNLVALKQLIKNKEMRNNIIFILEGEEEVGSKYLEKYVNEARDILANVDVFYIIDTGMYQRNIPQIYYGLRGLLYFELEIKTGSRDLHSGIYGNKVLNPIQILTMVLSSMKDIKTNKVLIPGFYNSVRELSPDEKAKLTKLIKDSKNEIREAGVYKLISIDDVDPYLSTKVYPSLDINGIESGYTGEGAKTVIPYSATAKFSLRLVEHQDPKNIQKLVEDHIYKYIPEGAKYTLKLLSADSPFYTDINNDYVSKTEKILSRVFGHETYFNRSGGTIPAAEVLQRLFNKPVILTGFVLSDCKMHAPDENYDTEMFFRGIKALTEIYKGI